MSAYNVPIPNPGNIPFNSSEWTANNYTTVPVTGGIMTGNLTVPSLNITNSTVSSSASTGCCILSGGLGISGAVNTSSSLTITGALAGVTTINSSGINTLTSTTQSTAYTNGALVCNGGVGVAKDIFSNGKLTIAGAISGATTINSSGINTLTATTASTAYTNGALVCSGGTGIAGDLHINGIINMQATAGDRKLALFSLGSTDYYGFGANSAALLYMSAFDHTWYTGSTPSSKGTQVGILTRTGALTITGALAKASGSFDIVHPIEKDKRLRHSFVESPTVDNIYRGKVQLIDGIAKVNLNQKWNMTPGTISALNNNFDIYLQNNTSFDRVISTLENDILSIECENKKSNDIISFLVIAERQDEFILSWDATDENGHLICEYQK